MEPTGDPFNSIIKLETTSPSKPLNPMINAGALAITSMLEGKDNEEKMERILHFVREITDNPTINYSSKVADSELETAYLNRSLCYYMKQNGIIDCDIEELMDLYTRQCAVEVNCIDLARIGLIFAMDGYDPYKRNKSSLNILQKFAKHLWSHVVCITNLVNLQFVLVFLQKWCSRWYFWLRKRRHGNRYFRTSFRCKRK